MKILWTTYNNNGGILDSMVTKSRLLKVKFLFPTRVENKIVPSNRLRRTCPTVTRTRQT